MKKPNYIVITKTVSFGEDIEVTGRLYPGSPGDWYTPGDGDTFDVKEVTHNGQDIFNILERAGALEEIADMVLSDCESFSAIHADNVFSRLADIFD